VSYKVNRALGFQRWGVTNPFVFADLSQPQRLRGGVSPVVFQTQPPSLRSVHLGQLSPVEELKRAERMETIAIAGFAVSLASLYLGWQQFSNRKKMASNRRKRRKAAR